MKTQAKHPEPLDPVQRSQGKQPLPTGMVPGALPTGMILGACVEAVTVHCERASSRWRIYLHIMDRCRTFGQHEALNYATDLDPIYDMLLNASRDDRKEIDKNNLLILDLDDEGASDRPYQVASQTIDLTSSPET